MNELVCVACRRQIDASAKLCPYCGADPRTGTRVDTQAILEEVFRPRATGTTTDNVLEYARQRQGIVIALSVVVGVILISLLLQFINRRNAREVSNAAAIPLTEVVDTKDNPDEGKQQPMPELQFQYDGQPQSMRMVIVEPGAVTPPEVVAAQQQAAATATAAPAQQAKH